MRTQKESYQLFLSAIVVLMFTSVLGSAQAAIVCETNFGEKSFVIEKSTVAFVQTKQTGRNISSVLGSVTKATHTGFKKVVYKDGNKHLINISNTKKFDSNNDFLAVTSPRGHKMTFPLNCSLVN